MTNDSQREAMLARVEKWRVAVKHGRFALGFIDPHLNRHGNIPDSFLDQMVTGLDLADEHSDFVEASIYSQGDEYETFLEDASYGDHLVLTAKGVECFIRRYETLTGRYAVNNQLWLEGRKIYNAFNGLYHERHSYIPERWDVLAKAVDDLREEMAGRLDRSGTIRRMAQIAFLTRLFDPYTESAWRTSMSEYLRVE